MNLTEEKIEFYSKALLALHEAMTVKTLNNLAEQELELSEADVKIVSAFHESVIDEALEKGALDDFFVEEAEILENLNIVNDSVYIMTESKDLMFVSELPMTEATDFYGVHESSDGFETGHESFQESSKSDNIDDLVENLIESLNI